MAEVLCVGIAVLDRVFRVVTHPDRPGKYRASARAVVGGGVAANAAVTVARLGGRARFCGVVGDDDTGRLIVSGLEDEGVDTSGVQAIADGLSPESIIQVDSAGERLIINHASPDLFDRATLPEPQHVATADIVLVDMRWHQGAIAALRGAAEAGIPGLVDCDHDPADAPGLLEEASHIVFAASTLRAWTKHHELADALRMAARRTGAFVAATDGANGTMWLADGQLQHQPAVEVEVVDTLGAGDVFHGALALALAEGYRMDDSMRWASAAAALKCRRFGGRRGIPTRSELDEFVEERWS